MMRMPAFSRAFSSHFFFGHFHFRRFHYHRDKFRICQHFDAFWNFYILHEYRVADLELGDVDLYLLRYRRRQTFDMQLAHDVFEDTTVNLHAHRLPARNERDVDLQCLG